MIYRILFISCLIYSGMLNAQPLNQTTIENSDSTEIANGYFDRNLFETDKFKSWFIYEYDNYKPDNKVIKALKRRTSDNISIIIVMGTWCPDSRREVPRFYKVCNEIGITTNKIIGIAVKKSKTTDHMNIEHLQIERVPTFIIYYNEKEIGRIIETPNVSLEKDLLEIIRKKPE